MRGSVTADGSRGLNTVSPPGGWLGTDHRAARAIGTLRTAGQLLTAVEWRRGATAEAPDEGALDPRPDDYLEALDEPDRGTAPRLFPRGLRVPTRCRGSSSPATSTGT